MTAQISIDLVKTLLIVGDGIGPDRDMAIYKAPTARTLLKVGYAVQRACDPTSGRRSAEFGIDRFGLTFWRQIADTPTPKKCPGYAGFMNTTGSAAIEERSVLSFATRTVKGSGRGRCTARQ